MTNCCVEKARFVVFTECLGYGPNGLFKVVGTGDFELSFLCRISVVVWMCGKPRSVLKRVSLFLITEDATQKSESYLRL